MRRGRSHGRRRADRLRARAPAEAGRAARPDRLNRLAQIVLHAEAALALAAAVRGDLDTLAPSTRAIALPGWAMPAVWYRHALAQAAAARGLPPAAWATPTCCWRPASRKACRTATRSRPPARLRPARAGRAASPSRLRQFPGPAGAGAAGGPGRPRSPRQRAADRRAGQRGANAGLRPPVRPASLHVSATLTHGNHHVQDHRLPALSRFRVLDLSRVRRPDLRAHPGGLRRRRHPHRTARRRRSQRSHVRRRPPRRRLPEPEPQQAFADAEPEEA